MKQGHKHTAANLAMVAICLVAVLVSYVLPDLERIRDNGQPLAFAIAGGWLAVVFWTVDYRRTVSFVLLMVASAVGVGLTLWSIGFLATREAIAVGVVAAGLGVFAPRLR